MQASCNVEIWISNMFFSINKMLNIVMSQYTRHPLKYKLGASSFSRRQPADAAITASREHTFRCLISQVRDQFRFHSLAICYKMDIFKNVNSLF